jgi:hypothetical protein
MFAPLFNRRFAYAVSLGLIVIAGALSFHSFSRRTSDDGERQPTVIANVNSKHTAPPTVTTIATTAKRENLSVAPTQVGKRAKIVNAQSVAQQRRVRAQRTPPSVEQNLVALTNGTTQQVVAQEIATNGVEAAAQPEVSRIEMQTSDPNIRIIWLAPKAEAMQPLW